MSCFQTQIVTGSPRIYSFLVDESGCFERIEGVDAGQ